MNKPSHLEQIITWFKSRGGAATLGEVLRSGEPWSHEFNARKSNIRKQTRFDLVLRKGKNASDNLYVLFEREESGQLRLEI